MLSVVIPAYNEEKNIPVLVKRIEHIFKSNDFKGEIIIVNDNSTDGTSEIAKKLRKKYHNIKIIDRKDGLRGPGRTIREGLKHVKGDIVFTMDADLSHEPEEIPNFVRALKKADLVSGSRFMITGRQELNRFRRFISRTYSFVGNLLTGLKITDMATGFKAIKTSVIKELNLKATGFEIHPEILLKAKLEGFRIKEIPIYYAKRYSGKSKLKYVKEGGGYLRVIIESFIMKMI